MHPPRDLDTHANEIHRGAERSHRIGALLLVLLITGLVFSRTLGYGFVDHDDTKVLVENEAWRGLDQEHLSWMLTSLHMGHWHPLTWFTWAIDYALWGTDGRGYHLQNVLWHVLNALLCYALIRRLVRDFNRSESTHFAPIPI